MTRFFFQFSTSMFSILRVDTLGLLSNIVFGCYTMYISWIYYFFDNISDFS